MTGYDQEEWVRLYQRAILELEHAKIVGHIGDARIEIAARIAKLATLPDLHARERQALSDALTELRTLEREEARYVSDQARIAEEALEKLRILEGRFSKNKRDVA